MSFAEDYVGGYRVKFVDVRIKPPGGKRAAPGADARQKRCDHKGCDEVGDCPAPRHPSSLGAPQETHHFFCRRHAAEYNQSFDFFDGMTESEVKAFQASATWGHKPTWRFGSGPMGGARSAAAHDPKRWKGRAWFDPSAEAPAPEPKEKERTRLEGKAFDELHLAHSSTPQQVRDRFAELVKRFHPDSNGGDRSMEHKLSGVVRAFRTLKAAGLA
ncbi:molecular chaperone DnaJ [bacterium]|nr:molecular chaperone DnaJ [bacterium]